MSVLVGVRYGCDNTLHSLFKGVINVSVDLVGETFMIIDNMLFY